MEFKPVDFNNASHQNAICAISKNNRYYVDDLLLLIKGIIPKYIPSLPLLVEVVKLKMYKNGNYSGYFICLNKKPIGFMLYHISEYITLHFILVDKKYQKMGYGSLLLNNIKNRIIKVDADQDAISFYIKNDFSKESEKRLIYTP